MAKFSTTVPGSRAPASASFAGKSRTRRVTQRAACCELRATRYAPAKYSNPIGVHALVWTGGWEKKDIELAVKGSKDAGFDLIEVPMLEPETVDPKLTKSVLEEYGLQSTSSLGLTFATDISSEDSGVVRAGKDFLFAALEGTAGFGGTHLAGVTYCAMDKYRGPISAQSWKNCANTLKELAAKAEDLGVILGLEVVNRYETNILNTAAQAMDMIADVNKSNVVVHLDTYHMNIEENSFEQAITTCGDRLGYVHVGDSHRGYMGTGQVNWQAFFRAIAASGYDGPITFESFSSKVVSTSMSNALCIWRNLWEDSEHLAKHARNFIDTELTAAKTLEQAGTR
ncbi:hypothetical protein WJX72_007241 [[Myrmecia] bisecta]|uniref:Xylose isomerase-like TIM barrel domain-containing protein n=1 Tax=[Myrmecia] bisecta TaxID=41462 RepID=A0AAW1P9V5_9CHLO